MPEVEEKTPHFRPVTTEVIKGKTLAERYFVKQNKIPALGIEASYRVARIARPACKAGNAIKKEPCKKQDSFFEL